MADKGGVDRTHASSRPQKITFWGLHLLIILLCCWLVLGGEFDPAAERTISLTDLTRAQILLACAVIYFVRHGLTLFDLLARRIEWSEVFGLSAFFALFEVGLLLVGGGVFREAPVALTGLDIFAVVLYLSGSYLNTASRFILDAGAATDDFAAVHVHAHSPAQRIPGRALRRGIRSLPGKDQAAGALRLVIA